MIRVLIVDDSPTTRKMIRAILDSEPEIEVIAEAEDGVEAVELTAKLKPDVITMDVVMPRANGYQATKRIMETMPTPIVVLTSVTQQEMLHRGLDVLLAGALDIIEKPSTLTDRDYQVVSEELIEKIKEASQISMVR